MPGAFGRFMVPGADWVARAMPEEIIDPPLPIVDAHHHLWDRKPDANGVLHRYLLDDFLADAESGHTIVGTVFLEAGTMHRLGPKAMAPVGEVEFVNGVAAMSASGAYGNCRVAAGIVGRADLTLGDAVAPVLDALVAASPLRSRGVRDSATYDPDPIIGNGPHGQQRYRRPEVAAGLRQVAARGLTFDAWIYHTQITDLTWLARQVPEATIILNHCGGVLGYGPYAGRRDEIFSGWKRDLAELAAEPNVSVKLGGLMSRLGAIDFPALSAPPTSQEVADAWRPYIETSIELFGPKRAMFESNFPVDKVGVSYRTLWNAFKRIAAGASDDDRTALFSGTARRLYRLDENLV